MYNIGMQWIDSSKGHFSSTFCVLITLPMVYFGAKYGLRDSFDGFFGC